MGSKNKKNKNRKKRRTKGAASAVAGLPMILPLKVQAKIHQKAASRCRRAWENLTQLQLELTQYYKQDEPAYRSWYESNFSHFASERDEVVSSLRAISELIFAVNREAQYSNISLAEAYKRVTAAGYAFEGEDLLEDQDFSFGSNLEDDYECDCDECRAQRLRDAKNSSSEELGDDSEEELALDEETADAMFEEMVENLFNETHGDDFTSSRQRRRAFDAFRRKMAKESGYEDFKAQFKIEDEDAPRRFTANEGIDQEVRCVSIYRSLVKRLHPDLIVEQTRLHKELWQMTQTAYEQKDIAQLSKLQVLIAMLKGSALDGLSVADVEAAADELKHKTSQARKEIRQLKRGELWGFANLKASQLHQYFKKEQRQLNQEISYLRRNLKTLKGMLERFQRTKTRPQRRSNRSGESQSEFMF